MPGAWEEPGPGGATLYMGGCWELGVGVWGAVQSGWRRVWCRRKGSLLCPGEGAVPLLGPGGSTQPGWVARPWVPLCFLSSVPQAPMYLVGQQTLSLVLASRLKGQVPPTGAQSHQGRGCSHQEGVLFLFIIKLLGTICRCWSLVSGREEGRLLGSTGEYGWQGSNCQARRGGSQPRTPSQSMVTQVGLGFGVC